MIEIRKVEGRRMLRQFVSFPNELYRGHPCYVPNLVADETTQFIPEKNPASAFCESALFLAYEGNRVVGRIAAIVNWRAVEKYEENRGRFGYVDFIDDREVSRRLFAVAEKWLGEKGMDLVQGPLGFSDLDEEGMLTEGFDEMGTLTTIYNHPYYPEHLKALGYDEEVRWFEYEGRLPRSLDPRLGELATHLMEKYGLEVIRTRRTRDVIAYAKPLFELINRAYAPLYNITPLSEEQMAYYTKKYLSFINHQYVKLIVDREGSLVAFGLCLPSLAKAFQKAGGHLLPLGWWPILKAFRHNDRVEMLLIAVDPDYSRKGLPAILFAEFSKTFAKNGIRHADINPQLEDNKAVRNLWRHFDVRQHRKRACFIKKIE